MNFAETVAGQRFLNHDFPSLVKDSAEYEIEEYEAWLNYKGDHDWKIVELEVK